MASIVEIAPSAAAPTPAFRRIRAASRGFEILFAALFATFIGVAVLSLWVLLFYQGALVAVGPHGGIITTGPLPAGFVPFRDWSLTEKLAYAPVVIVRALPTILLFWFLRGLFRSYGKGRVFTADNAGRIKAMGACLVADAAAPFACHLVLSATGFEIDQMWAHMGSLQELVLGGVVFVIAGVMQVGREIDEDREGFV